MNSNSIFALVIHICFEDFHDTIAPPIVKTYPLADLESLVSNIQFALHIL